MSARGVDRLAFVDTNVLVHAYDRDAGAKHDVARALVEELWRSGTGALSVQVLQEFYVTVTRKMPSPLDGPAARALVEVYGAWPVHRPGAEDVAAASILEQRHRLSFWDAMIVRSATELGAALLWSEDLSAGGQYGDLVVRDPFAAGQD